MSGTKEEEMKHQEHVDHNPDKEVEADHPVEEKEEEVHDSGKCDENVMPSPEEEEEMIKKKYGGILPKKKPLISKDHERAFFDSADWALGKQGSQKPKGPLEALRPKLQPTPHNQLRSRRSSYAPADESDGDGGNLSAEDETSELEGGNNKKEMDATFENENVHGY